MKTQEANFSGMKLPGILTIFLNILFLVAIVVLFISQVNSDSPNGLLIILSILLFIFNMISWAGFMQIEPNEARVMVFLGSTKEL